jgi:polar amino acid transport system substrate-binding protein
MQRGRAALLIALFSALAVVAAACGGGSSGDMLQKIKSAGVIRVNTDPNYAPQSFQRPDGTFEGFDIDVANEIAKRLGVKTTFTTNSFDIMQAGSWNDRWDISVGSTTITTPRKTVLDFTQPYYYTPAQMAALTSSGITSLDGLAGKKVCVGTTTTYQAWLEGTLKLENAPPPATPPSGATAFPLETDQLCPQAVTSGRKDFDGWLSSSTTVADAIAANTPIVTVGDPVFYESLAVAFDKSAAGHASLQTEVDKIIGDMHTDGTLSALSMKWFKQDLTKAK